MPNPRPLIALPELPNLGKELLKSLTQPGAPRVRESTGVQVAILPEGYPQVALSVDEMQVLKENIVDEIAKGWDDPLHFTSILFKPGMLVIDCADIQSADWLEIKTPFLTIREGVELITKTGNDIPKFHFIKLNLYKSAGQKKEKSLALIRAQNEGMYTNCWRIVSSQDKESWQFIVLEIDDMSMQNIIQARYSLKYRFGNINVDLINSPEEKIEESEIK